MKLTGRWFCCIFSKLCRYVHQVMGVCCIFFDVDGMLFEFFMNFLNTEKNKILRNFVFKISCFFTFHAISNIQKIWCWKIFFFFRKTIRWKIFFFRKIILSHFTFYAIFNIKKKIYIEKCPFTYWWWFLQIVDIETVAIYIHYILYSLVLILYLKCGGGLRGGGGVMVFSHVMLFTTFLEKKYNYFSFNVFFMFFYAGNIEKCPFTYWLSLHNAVKSLHNAVDSEQLLHQKFFFTNSQGCGMNYSQCVIKLHPHIYLKQRFKQVYLTHTQIKLHVTMTDANNVIQTYMYETLTENMSGMTCAYYESITLVYWSKLW